MAKPKEKPAPKPAIEIELAQVEKEYEQKVRLTTARPALQGAFYTAWMVIDVLLLVIFVSYIGYYLVSGSFAERREVANIANNLDSMRSISEDHQAAALVSGETLVFTPQEGFADFYSELRNPNEEWTASFDYHFSGVFGESATQRGFIMPLETKSLISLHQAVTGRATTAQIVIEDVEWLRVDAHAISDVSAWLTAHNDFSVTDAVYDTNLMVDDQKVGRSSFTITNDSPYGYHQAMFTVILERGGTPAGIHQVTLNSFDTGDVRQVDLNWFGTFPGAADVVVVPNIDYFDVDAYLPPASGAAEDIRDVLLKRRR
jgi:hypothetical protein